MCKHHTFINYTLNFVIYNLQVCKTLKQKLF
nr:MAG TPA: hypothetical protein [Caudoviricetes sp.]